MQDTKVEGCENRYLFKYYNFSNNKILSWQVAVDTYCFLGKVEDSRTLGEAACIPRGWNGDKCQQ